MKIVRFILAVALFGGGLQAETTESFSDGYIVCVFDQPATITNEGSKLRVGVQDPASHRWVALPFSDGSSSPRSLRELVATDNSTDEVGSGGVLTIKKPASIVLWNFKGGIVDVKFSVLPKRIKRLSYLPRRHWPPNHALQRTEAGGTSTLHPSSVLASLRR